MNLAVETEQLGASRCRIALAGEIDMYTAPRFQRELQAALDGGNRTIVVDLTATSFVDSTFLGLLISGRERLADLGGEINIVCDNSNIHRIFEITGLDRVFAIQDGAEDRASLTPGCQTA